MRKIIFILIILIVAGGAYYLGHSTGNKGEKATATAKKDKVQIWTCSMHPQVRLPEPGQCPICGMDLIPADEAPSADLGPRELKLSDYAKQLADIETMPVERRFVDKHIRMVGKIGYDETRLGYVTAWVPGRLDKLYVDFTGAPVNKGQHMVYIYSPELLTAQEELIQAKQSVQDLKNSNLPSMRETAQLTVESARKKLELWGLSDEQIAAIEKRGTPEDHLTINAPISGIVIHKNALEGMYVKTGTRIYTIADLQHLWVEFDAYETDLPWLKYGQKVEFTTQSLPGERFVGTISFIEPFLNDKTRSVNVRVNVDNPDGRLKPDMFVHGIALAKLNAEGKVVSPDLAGKWICPMHPEIVKDGPGQCDICDMDLVPTSTLGYASVKSEAPLLIPASAPLITGKRAVVYIQKDDGIYEGREIALGPRAGDWYTVHSGLKEGDLVVTNGNFKIDSALQIKAKPSMMSPDDEKKPAAEVKNIEAPTEFKAQLQPLYAAYFQVQKDLAQDNFQKAADDARAVLQAAGQPDMKLLKHEAHLEWMRLKKAITKAAKKLESTEEAENTRQAFLELSARMIELSRNFAPDGSEPIYQFHCPMAFNNKGGDWLQTSSDTQNPYFGSAMLKCGDKVEVFNPGNSEEQ